MAALSVSVLTPTKELKLESKLVLAGLSLGLTIKEASVQLGWSDSKLMRWRAALQDTFGMNILAVLVMLINENRFDPIRAVGMFSDDRADMLELARRKLLSHRLSPAEQQMLVDAFVGYPMQTDWSTETCPPEFLAILGKAGIKPPPTGDLSGYYALIMAAAACSDQINWRRLPQIWTAKVEIDAPGGVKITIVGPPGIRVQKTIDVVIPGASF